MSLSCLGTVYPRSLLLRLTRLLTTSGPHQPGSLMLGRPRAEVSNG